MEMSEEQLYSFVKRLATSSSSIQNEINLVKKESSYKLREVLERAIDEGDKETIRFCTSATDNGLGIQLSFWNVVAPMREGNLDIFRFLVESGAKAPLLTPATKRKRLFASTENRLVLEMKGARGEPIELNAFYALLQSSLSTDNKDPCSEQIIRKKLLLLQYLAIFYPDGFPSHPTAAKGVSCHSSLTEFIRSYNEDSTRMNERLKNLFFFPQHALCVLIILVDRGLLRSNQSSSTTRFFNIASRLSDNCKMALSNRAYGKDAYHLSHLYNFFPDYI